MDKTYIQRLREELARAESRLAQADLAVERHKEVGLPLEAERVQSRKVRDNIREMLLDELEALGK